MMRSAGEMPKARARSERPRFQNICGFQGFNIRRADARLRQKAYPGMVVASADAFYIALDEKRMVLGAAGALTGAVGALVAGASGGARKKLLPVSVPLVEEKDVAELASEILDDPEWPVPWKAGPVVVMPRKAVKSLRTSFWLGGIELTIEGVRILVITPFLKRKRAARDLLEFGWEVAGI